MAKPRKLDRRTFIGAAAGAAGATALGPALSLGHGKDDDTRASTRAIDSSDVTAWATAVLDPRLDHAPRPVRPGIPRRPELPPRPADLGPLVALPGGFAAVFEYLASVGYAGFEFFSFDAGGQRRRSPRRRSATALDNAGLKAAGTHTGGLAAMTVPANRPAQIDMASSSATG